VLLVAAVAVVAGIAFTKDDAATDPGKGCAAIRTAAGAVRGVEERHDRAPVSSDYAQAARTVRAVAVDARADVAVPLTQIADAYVRRAALMQGFDPNDPSTYRIVEDATLLDAQQAIVDDAYPQVRTWIAGHC
jgi:hypothetical protein